ncbi:Arc family DNA-binding protein (plasmid) [Moraxella osloensis]|nr:Arc family DNA-binding protein [Moraxella osloensis]
MSNIDEEITIRLPVEIKEQLQISARLNDRSLNDELNTRLINSFSIAFTSNQKHILNELRELFKNYQDSNRLTETSSRLQRLLEEGNQLPRLPKLRPSHIAYALGYEKASIVEAWFEGCIEPTFKELLQIAEFYGCQKDWLYFGGSTPFKPNKLPTFDSFDKLVNFMATSDEPHGTLRKVYLIRQDDLTGNLGIIKQHGDWSCQFYTTDIFLNDCLNDNNAYDTAFFTLAIHALRLDKISLQCQTKAQYLGYSIDAVSFQRLLSGEEHPLKIIQNGNCNEWCFKILNMAHGLQKNHWSNSEAFYKKNLDFINNNPYLQDIYQSI